MAILMGCGTPSFESQVRQAIQSMHPGDSIQVTQVMGSGVDTDLDLTDTESNSSLIIEELRRARPFKVIRVRYRAPNKMGLMELEDRLVIISKNGNATVDVSDEDPHSPLGKIREKLR